MADPRRIKRLQQVILHAAAEHIQHELDDPRIGLVTLTRVKLATDLSRCQLYWSCLGDDPEVRTTERGLTDALASIQRAVAGAMQTRTTPRLGLIHDASLAHVEKLETIFTHLRHERGEGPEEGAELDEDAPAAEAPDSKQDD